MAPNSEESSLQQIPVEPKDPFRGKMETKMFGEGREAGIATSQDSQPRVRQIGEAFAGAADIGDH